jgi:hypothetical protein
MSYIADRHPEGRYCVKDSETGEIVTGRIHRISDAQELAELMNEEEHDIMDALTEVMDEELDAMDEDPYIENLLAEADDDDEWDS